MKKIAILVLLSLSMSTGFAQTKAPTEAANFESASNEIWNIRLSPFAFLLGALNAQVDYRLDDNWTAGPNFLYWNGSLLDWKVKATGFGASAKYAFDGAYSDSFYLGGGLGFSSVEVSIVSLGVTYTGSATGTGIIATGGYQWFWDNFNLNLGLTLGTSSVSDIEVKDSNGGKYNESSNAPSSSTGLDFLMGYKF